MTDKRIKSPGRPKSSEQTHSTRELILKSAIKLFLDRGYQAVSVDDIALESNVTKATVYYYFSSKPKLFTEAMIQMMEQINIQIQSVLAQPGTLKERLLQVTKAHLKATFQLNIDTFMQGAKDTISAEQKDTMEAAEEKMYKSMENAFTDAIHSGEMPPVNPVFATQCYLSLLQVGNYRDKENNPIFPAINETAQHIVTFFWNGLGKHGDGSSASL